MANCTRPLLISFSGIDGAGKTTQIELLLNSLREIGLRVSLVRFWDDIAAFRKLRENTGHALFRGEKGIGAPNKPVRRRDKNVQTWYMVPIRLGLCLLDTVSLRLKAMKLKRRRDADVLLFDRYLYDQAANLDIRNPLLRAYIQLLFRFTPSPDKAILLDADPAAARARKPEYPLEFVCGNRNAYLELSKIAGMRVVAPGTPEEVSEKVKHELAAMLQRIEERPAPQVLTSM